MSAMKVTDRIVAALVSRPVRAVAMGLLTLGLCRQFLGWWTVVALAGAVILDLARWPRGWRPW